MCVCDSKGRIFSNFVSNNNKWCKQIVLTPFYFYKTFSPSFNSYTFTISLSFSLSLTHTHTFTPCLSYTHSHSVFFSHTRTHLLSLTDLHTHSLTKSTLKHTHTHSHAISFSSQTSFSTFSWHLLNACREYLRNNFRNIPTKIQFFLSLHFSQQLPKSLIVPLAHHQSFAETILNSPFSKLE